MKQVSFNLDNPLADSGTLAYNPLVMMATVDRIMGTTVQPVESSKVTGCKTCGEKANGRDGLGQFTVADILVSSRRIMTAIVVQIMVILALSVITNS